MENISALLQGIINKKDFPNVKNLTSETDTCTFKATDLPLKLCLVFWHKVLFFLLMINKSSGLLTQNVWICSFIIKLPPVTLHNLILYLCFFRWKFQSGLWCDECMLVLCLISSTGMCAKCGQSIMGENTGCTALDQLFHIGCFTCVSCGECRGVDSMLSLYRLSKSGGKEETEVGMDACVWVLHAYSWKAPIMI